MKKCDKVLLVTKLGLATSDMLNSIKSALDANGIDAFGLIINQVKSKEFKKLRRLGYGYGYGYYYDNNSKNAKT